MVHPREHSLAVMTMFAGQRAALNLTHIHLHDEPPPSSRPLGWWAVDRIAVIGCGGSGKSPLARELGALLDITPVHLDGLYYDRTWTPLDPEQFAALQRDLVREPPGHRRQLASTLTIRLETSGTVIFHLPRFSYVGVPVGHRATAAMARPRAARRNRHL